MEIFKEIKRLIDILRVLIQDGRVDRPFLPLLTKITLTCQKEGKKEIYHMKEAFNRSEIC